MNQPYTVGDPESAKMMAALDDLSPGFRALIHEYGAIIVSRMIGDGYDDADQLRGVLETWRERQQAQWLATNYFEKRTEAS